MRMMNSLYTAHTKWQMMGRDKKLVYAGVRPDGVQKDGTGGGNRDRRKRCVDKRSAGNVQ